MTNQFKPGVADQVFDVFLRAGKEVIYNDDFVALLDKPVA